MNQEQNNLNLNNFNTQNNNTIPNNQPLTNQNFNQSMSFNQQPINIQSQPTPNYEQPITQKPTPQPINNNFESSDVDKQNLNNKPPKKVNLGLIIGLVSVIIIISIIIIINMRNNKNNSEVNSENINKTEEIIKDYSINNSKYASYTANYPINKRNIDYYWNINTETFDKNKFDGRISFFGNLMTSKLTGKTLADNGYNFSKVTSYSCNDEFYITDNELEKDYTQTCGKYIKNNISYPVDGISLGSFPKLINFEKNDNFTNDNVEIVFDYHYTNKYLNFVTLTEESNIIFPYFNGIKYDDITIDVIIENMGVPTYVEGRKDKINSIDMFDYYYVYDDYVFKFDFLVLSDNISFTGVSYMGINIFTHKRVTYTYDENGNDKFIIYTLKENLDKEYKEYLKAVFKK